MSQEITKKQIKESLKVLKESPNLFDSACAFFDTLGYRSNRRLGGQSGQPKEFTRDFASLSGVPNTKTENFFIENIRTVQILFQVTEAEIKAETEQGELFEDNEFQIEEISSFVFLVADLQGEKYTRSDYATLAREISKRLPMPVFVLFRHNDVVSLAFADRRPSKSDKNLDVLGKISLLHKIDCKDPHAGHLSILVALSLSESLKRITQKQERRSFDTLHKALLSELDTEELNKRFYGEIFKWFQWAVNETKFPDEKEGSEENHVIRLITRMLFVWFMKEKRLIADDLFIEAKIKNMLKNFGGDSGDYYRAILQNLFFATLNTEIGKRDFSSRAYKTHRNFNLYRYEDLIKDKDSLLELMQRTPFINGGLFDCLDSYEATGDGGYRLDCFTDNKTHRKKLHIPDKLFFDGTDGLLTLFNKYKFTVEESTPIEQEVALDPELLGKVFENLLAAYNPETSETARKQTGSYYTPRVVVDYMVDESLIAHLMAAVKPEGPEDICKESWQKRLRDLLDYAATFNDAHKHFTEKEKEDIVQVISEIKVLDPAVGSGAFPMGILHKLVLILSRLDQDNTRWQELQKKRAMEKTGKAYDNLNRVDREPKIIEISEIFERYSSFDFGRKLFLIQNSIFGVDIQPVACQIAKLRFFISLAIEQEKNEDRDNNYGIKPLPNLETNFVNANTLLPITEDENQGVMDLDDFRDTEKKLKEVREKYFGASIRRKKFQYIKEFKKIQQDLVNKLIASDWDEEYARKIAFWNPFDQNSVVDWFDPELMFGIPDGFDIVIGNPPYIRQELIKIYKKYFEKIYKETYDGTVDIYVLFYERGVQLLSEKGHLCYITSNKWIRAKYGKRLRSFMRPKVMQIIDFRGHKIFEASVDTNILLCTKTETNADFNYGFQLPTASEQKLYTMLRKDLDTQAYILEPPHVLAIKKKIEEKGTPLRDWDVKIYRGILTGYNAAFIINTSERNKLIEKDPRSAEIIKPILRGRDIKFYQSDWEDLWVINSHNGYGVHSAIDINHYPAIKKYLDAYYSQLEKRSDRGSTPYNLRSCSYIDEFEKEKIAFPVVNRKWNFPLIHKGVFILAPMRFITAENSLRYIKSVLGSNTLKAYWKIAGPMQDDSGYQMDSYFVERLPVPMISSEKQQPFITLVNEIMAAEKKDASADISQHLKQIDSLTYKLYDLNEEEAKTIEEIIDKVQK